ncbi:hypothetical protein [Pseudomonas fluorescens]|uniref:hypothetical protein n=1 Tax=Pseudomonas fluorescens TaxID=294 RepID=UPI0012B999D1|nr:hypothetical protein [Pseudomonas fluorescens]
MTFETTILILAFIVIYVVIPAWLGWMIKKFDASSCEIAVMVVVTLFWAGAILTGAHAISLGLDKGKEFFAISTASLTLACTIYGELFNTPTEKDLRIKVRKSKIKASITIFRAAMILVFTIVYFQPWR